MDINPLSQLYTDFLIILDKCVIKYKNVADLYETIDSKKNADGYIRAYLGEDTFETYYRYNKDIIANVMSLTDDNEIETYYYNRNAIPMEYRDTILKSQREYVLNSYIETNNYYRCLSGLPNLEEKEIDFIYLDSDIVAKYKLPADIPIHEMSDSQIGTLESIGYIDELLQKYPSKTYIKYLGGNSIDIITARKGRNFALLRVPYDITESLLNTFMLIYEQCREYFMTCIYIPEYRTTIDYYDNFIALCIMVMTMQQVISRTIKGVIERDFFDVYCCKLLFSAYGVPFYSEMDNATRTQMVQNLNMLVKNKGTNQVIYDIASILGYNRLDIYKYYIMRVRKFDADGLPITVETVDPETGETVLNYKQMYDVYFQKAIVGDDDAYHSTINANDKISYLELTENDPYWIDDEKLQKELYETEYNYMESKYMGIGISYRMTNILFENVYLLRMLMDKKDQLPGIIVDIPKLSTYKNISLFDAVIILCAMICKQNNLKGNILTDISKFLYVLDFKFSDEFQTLYSDANTSTSENKDDWVGDWMKKVPYHELETMGIDFSKNADEITEEIKNNKYLDNSLCEFFKDLSSYNAEKINALYKNYRNLYDELIEKMATTTDIKVYQAYKKFFNAIFYTKESREMFNIGTDDNPQYPSTYMEYLKHTNVEMYEFIEETGPDNLYSNINYIISRITAIIPDLKYLGFFDGHSNTMETMLWELIQFFKSYTTDLIDMNIIYIFDLKPENLLRLIEHISISSNITTRDAMSISYNDHVDFLSTVRYNSGLNLYGKLGMINNVNLLFDNKFFLDKLTVNSNTVTKDNNNYFDIITSISNQLHIETRKHFNDLINISSKIYKNTEVKVFDRLVALTVLIMHKENLTLKEVIKILENIEISDIYKLSDIITSFTVDDFINVILHFREKVTDISKMSNFYDNNNFEDFSNMKNTATESDKSLRFNDTCTISYI